MDHGEKAGLYRQGLRLEYFTVGYNVLEGVASVIAGALAGSIALVGFGLDSAIESLSGGVLIWRLRHPLGDEAEQERLERRATRFVGYTFFLLGAYVLYEAVRKLYLREAPEGSLAGIIIALLSVIIMPLLARRKRRVGERLGSRALIADSRETIACMYLSVALLLGLLLNYFLHWWWADPVASLVIVLFLIKEGRECLEGEEDEETEGDSDG